MVEYHIECLYIFQHMCTCYSGVPQTVPVYDPTHVHVYPFVASLHMPPFLQGLLLHSKISATRATPFNNMTQYCIYLKFSP